MSRMALLPFRSKKSLAYCVLSLPLVVGCTFTTGPAQPATQTPAAVPPPPPPAATPAQPQTNNDDNWEGEDEATRRPRAHDNIDRRRARPQIGNGGAAEPTPARPTPTPTPATTAATGAHRTVGLEPTGETRTSEAIAKVVRDNRQPFRDCYERSAAKDPNLQGTLTLHFVLDPEGRVKLAELNEPRSTIKDANVVNCAIGVLKTLHFPPSSRGMESVANYPFDFKR